MYLGALLTGKALGVYARMPSNEANDYFKLKCALLAKFQNTEDRCRLIKEERNLDKNGNFKIELVKAKHEIAVSHSLFGSESFQRTSSQVLPTKGENSFSQPEISAEREEPSPQDLSILPTLSKWEKNEDE